jgi:DNA excision repair protein ERCC-2
VARHMLNRANIVVYNYQYMLDPKVANLVSRELEQESIVVFDEAHNIDNVCIEAFSITLDRRKMEASLRGIHRLGAKITEQVNKRKQDFQNEYNTLVQGLIAEGTWQAADQNRGNPLLSEDQLQEAVPGSIRKNEHFVAFLKKIVVYYKTLLDGQEVSVETALSFLMKQGNGQVLDRKAMKFTASRLNSLMRLLEISKIEEFSALLDVATFATLLATYTEEGFNVVFEPQGSMVAGINEPLLQLCCLDASIAIKPVFDRFQSVIITSGTLSPINDYAKLLNFEPVIKQSFPMSTFRDCLLPLIVTRGRDQVPISSKFESRMDPSVIRNYGELLVDVSATVPDGICAFFTSYSYMEIVLDKWEEWGIIDKIWANKLIFMETKDVLETQQALDNFKRSCDLGRGAVFLSIARGKVAEGVDFDKHYGRCVLLFGIPIQYTQSHVLRARMAYILQKYQIREQEFLVFDALRQAAQCVGRVIRSKEDYGVVILADFRYNKQDKRSKMPQWIQQFLRESSLNVSTDVAIDNIKAYLKVVGQPIDRYALERIVLNEAQVKDKQRGVSQYRLKATQAELERISRESAARRPGLFGADKDKPTAVAMADAAAALGAGFDVDHSEQEAMIIAQAQEEEEEAARREAERYIEEEEANLLADVGERLPDGSVLETRRLSSDLVVSINKRSERTLEGSESSGSAGAKRSREGAASTAPSPTTPGVMMFLDSDDD